MTAHPFEFGIANYLRILALRVQKSSYYKESENV